MKFHLGCRRGLPDPRDWYIDSHPVAKRFFHTKDVFGRKISAWDNPDESSVDLRKYCSPIEDQLALGSCTAQAAAGMVEFLERRAHGNHIDASRLFIYKTTRNLEGDVGDVGAYLRTTMKSLVLFGAPPEKYWPYDVVRYDDEPSAFCYAYGQSFQTLRYFRLDHRDRTLPEIVNLTRSVLRANLPVALGFLVFNFGNDAGEFEMPGVHDPILGGHAVVAVGYDDEREIGGHKGALLIRNSWGTAWGDKGYGWLPYGYITGDLAWDMWTMFRAEYLDERKFD